jgi:hypothetical protein
MINRRAEAISTIGATTIPPDNSIKLSDSPAVIVFGGRSLPSLGRRWRDRAGRGDESFLREGRFTPSPSPSLPRQRSPDPQRLAAPPARGMVPAPAPLARPFPAADHSGRVDTPKIHRPGERVGACNMPPGVKRFVSRSSRLVLLRPAPRTATRSQEQRPALMLNEGRLALERARPLSGAPVGPGVSGAQRIGPHGRRRSGAARWRVFL